jgi:hypothetical protein
MERGSNGEQNRAQDMSGDWTKHPSLEGRFHVEFPDDLQVIVHDGHPTIIKRGPELVWVRVTACEREVRVFGGNGHLAVFRGIVLNKPHHLVTVSEGTEIQFVAPKGRPHPLYVTAQYLEERPSWRLLAGCKTCGLSELFCTASELAKHSFPGMTDTQLSGFMFTTHCGWCGGGQVVRLMRKPLSASEES